MNPEHVNLVYESLIGELMDPISGIENAYVPGGKCDELYEDMLSAYNRLCGRLGIEGEDRDIEIIINNLLQIQRILCTEMYRYGVQFGSKNRESQ